MQRPSKLRQQTSNQQWRPAVPIGIGTMHWGRTKLDQYVSGQIIPQSTLDTITARAIAKGVTFFDTAEGYGGGTSEISLSRALCNANVDPASVCCATKFLPTLWRWSQSSFITALEESNKRLGVKQCELFFIHSPMHPLPMETWVRAAATAYKEGKLKLLGLSNFNADQVRRACGLARELGVPIAANQIQFNMLTAASPRVQETLAECKRNNVTIIAYAPLAQGLLAKPDLSEAEARKSRILKITGLQWEQLQPLRAKIMDIASSHPGHTMSHVCLSWIRAKGAVPLVGVRKIEHLEDALAAEWLVLSDEEIRSLDKLCLGKHTFEKPRWRRSLFVVFISLLMMAYQLTRLIWGDLN